LQKVIKITLFILAIILVFISFALAGSGQDLYLYAGCGFGLAGILAFMMSMRPGKKTAAQGPPATEKTQTEEK
jgi:hypothetical protein